MFDSLCEELTNDLLTIAEAGQYFCDDLRAAKPGEGKVAELMEMQKFFQEHLAEYMKNKFSVNGYLERIENPDNWRLFGELLKEEEVIRNIEKDEVNLYSLVKFVFARYPILLQSDSADELDDFYKRMRWDEKLREVVALAYPEVEGKSDESKIKKLIDSLKTALIHRVLESQGRLEIGDKGSTTKKSDYIGFNMTRGLIKMPSIGDHCGYAMKGGRIEAESVGNMAAQFMKDGEIHCENIGDGAGMMMDGGRIYARSVGEKFGWIAGGGVFFADYANHPAGNSSSDSIFIIGHAFDLPMMKRSGVFIANETTVANILEPDIKYTALVNRLNISGKEQIKELKTKGEIFGYDDEKGQYIEHLHGNEIFSPKNDQELAEWKEKKIGLCLIDELLNISGDPTAGLKDGIMVLRAIPDGEICAQMEGGVVILEVPFLTYKKAQEIVKMDRKITGVVLMRITDGEIDGKTKLIEVK